MKVEDLIMVSLDDHVVEPPGMFDQHLTVQQKAFAPQYVRDNENYDYWLFDGQKSGNIGLNAVVGRPRNEYGMEPISQDQMREGCWNVTHARPGRRFPT